MMNLQKILESWISRAGFSHYRFLNELKYSQGKFIKVRILFLLDHLWHAQYLKRLMIINASSSSLVASWTFFSRIYHQLKLTLIEILILGQFIGF